MEERMLIPPNDTTTEQGSFKNLQRCKCCLDPSDDLRPLGIEIMNLKAEDDVCSYCYEECNNNYHLIN
jgi:hypothetical protein